MFLRSIFSVNKFLKVICDAQSTFIYHILKMVGTGHASLGEAHLMDQP